MDEYSTDAFPPRNRFAYWREVLTQRFVRLRPERTEESAFFGRIHSHQFGDCSFSMVEAGFQRVVRGKSEIACSTNEVVFLNLHLSGTGYYQQGPAEFRLAAGDLFVIDGERPFLLGCPDPLAQISVKFPRPLLSGLLDRSDDIGGLFIPRSSYIGRLLGSFITHHWGNCPTAPPTRNHATVEQLAQLAAYEAGRRRRVVPLPRQAIHAGLYAAAVRHIATFSDLSALTPKAVAADLGISIRTLQEIFRTRNNAIGRQIQKSKLDRAVTMLRAPEHASKPIGDIAFAAGFNELSHFTHAFVRRFGMPPGIWRQQTD